jgi:hypothetical protein
MMPEHSNGLSGCNLQNPESLNSAEYLYYLIAYHCSPVLESAKPAVTLTFCNERRRSLHDLWKANRDGIPCSQTFDYYELRSVPDRATVLFYNPDALQRILSEAAVRDFLTGSGYREELTVETALAELSRRYQAECPHELGVFLGIPLPDVLSFIEFKGKKAVAAGYWKVYHDAGGRLALFARYQEAKRNFVDFITAGNSPAAYLRKSAVLSSREGGTNDGDCYFWRGPLGEDSPVVAGTWV